MCLPALATAVASAPDGTSPSPTVGTRQAGWATLSKANDRSRSCASLSRASPDDPSTAGTQYASVLVKKLRRNGVQESAIQHGVDNACGKLFKSLPINPEATTFVSTM